MNYRKLRKAASSQLLALPESIQKDKFKSFLRSPPTSQFTTPINSTISKSQSKTILTASLANFLLHCESRTASFLGHGFYTIGPCGEENLACLGLLARPTDSFALHYRHLSASIARQLASGISLQDVILERARGYTVSKQDSVTGGRHCALGGSPYDFYVTSTLASQAPPAVARALGFGLASQIFKSNTNQTPKFPEDAVSVVSVGDGSVNNNMFLSALNFSQYAASRAYKCPILFVVSNNELCISLKNYGYLDKFLDMHSTALSVERCDGMNVLDVFKSVERNLDQVRLERTPRILVIDNLPRRFGHAATDRQSAYLGESEITQIQDKNPIENTIQLLGPSGLGFFSLDEVIQQVDYLEEEVLKAFEVAVSEDKILTRDEAKIHTSASLTNIKSCSDLYTTRTQTSPRYQGKRKKVQTMRENMTQVYEETLRLFPECVYLGEDVRHGGYYLVTDSLFSKYKHRVQDVPPDETMLTALGMGYSQCGLLPIVEIPYSKYLDCGADMFFEAALTHWCTSGKQSNGMLIRLQGFDRGVFGGNFHTHNSLHIPPGLDVVCFSNGEDYVTGIRYAISQASKGRVVMSVDSTDLLNKRSKTWMKPFKEFDPTNHVDCFTSFDDIFCYTAHNGVLEKTKFTASDSELKEKINESRVLVYTYGNGVPLAVELLEEEEYKGKVCVLDGPYLSDIPEGFVNLLEDCEVEKVVFADVCKEGNSPLSGQIMRLRKKGILPKKWDYIAAENTYNPLGSMVTFLSKDDLSASISQFI